jgi:hypothetical protein
VLGITTEHPISSISGSLVRISLHTVSTLFRNRIDTILECVASDIWHAPSEKLSGVQGVAKGNETASGASHFSTSNDCEVP